MFSSANKQSSISSIVSYTIPKLYTGKCWYIGFRAFNPATGKMQQQRIKLNHIDGISARKKYATGLIFRLSAQLDNGWNPFVEAENSKSYHTFKDVCDRYKAYNEKLFKEDNIKDKTLYGYMSMLRTLIKWNSERKISITYIYQFDKSFVGDFLDYIYVDRENSIRTRNNYLTWLSVFDTYLVEHSYVNVKPTTGISAIRRKSKKKNRDIISPVDITRLSKYLNENNKHFLLATYLIFYGFVRPKEMSHLKLEYFNLINQTLYIPSEISKSGKSDVVTLPKKIILLMAELRVFDNPSSNYLFSFAMKPGPERRDERQFREYWDVHVRKDLNFSERLMFYSLKDTGISDMIREEDALTTRDQARHSDLSITNVYTDLENDKANPILLNYDGLL